MRANRCDLGAAGSNGSKTSSDGIVPIDLAVLCDPQVDRAPGIADGMSVARVWAQNDRKKWA